MSKMYQPGHCSVNQKNVSQAVKFTANHQTSWQKREPYLIRRWNLLKLTLLHESRVNQIAKWTKGKTRPLAENGQLHRLISKLIFFLLSRLATAFQIELNLDKWNPSRAHLVLGTVICTHIQQCVLMFILYQLAFLRWNQLPQVDWRWLYHFYVLRHSSRRINGYWKALTVVKAYLKTLSLISTLGLIGASIPLIAAAFALSQHRNLILNFLFAINVWDLVITNYSWISADLCAAHWL